MQSGRSVQLLITKQKLSEKHDLHENDRDRLSSKWLPCCGRAPHGQEQDCRHAEGNRNTFRWFTPDEAAAAKALASSGVQ